MNRGIAGNAQTFKYFKTLSGEELERKGHRDFSERNKLQLVAAGRCFFRPQPLF